MELSKQIKNIEQRQIYRFIDSTCTTCNVMEVVWNGIVFMFVWNRNVFCCQN